MLLSSVFLPRCSLSLVRYADWGRGEFRWSNRHILLLLLLLLPLVAPSSTHGQGKDGGLPTTKTTFRLEELRAQGSEALFNLDYDVARQRFNEITRLYPDDPIGPQMLGTTLWLETLNRARRLQAAIYSTESFYSKTEDKPDPRLTKDFNDLTRAATRLATARLRLNPRDPQALYVLGATESLKASFAATVERRFIAALRNGSSGVERHRDVIKLDPNFRDAELTIGMYDFIVGNLPLPARILAGVAGIRGSKKRGIQTLERVAKEGHWMRDDAKVLLIAIYKREKHFPKALALSRELHQKYPRNYLLSLETADTLVSLAALARKERRTTEAEPLEREALDTFEQLIRESHTKADSPRALDLIHVRYGEGLLLMDQPGGAAEQFLAATAVRRADGGLVSRAHLLAAQAFDVAGKRNEALAQYRIVLSRPNVYDSHDQARRGLKKPYKGP
jgi:tetratricopeptide (TPR) repeat protein